VRMLPMALSCRLGHMKPSREKSSCSVNTHHSFTVILEDRLLSSCVFGIFVIILYAHGKNPSNQ
jgi:hypothetical protein